MTTLDVEKTVHRRLIEVLGSDDLTRVLSECGASVFRRSSVFHGLESFLAENEVRARHAVEVGTCHGITAVVLSRFCTRVTSIDIAPSAKRLAVARAAGATNITFLDARDNDHKAELVRGLEFDLAYLDGDHAADTQADWELVRGCGRVLFHEDWDLQPPVRAIVNSLPHDEVTRGGVCLALWESR